VKLAKELSKRATGRTLYILDEPTTGLHFEDVNKLLEVLHELVDGGNTVLVIEHNLDVVKTADWVLDIGPEGGDGGGKLIAAGTPEDIAACKESWTGRFLAETFRRQDERRAARNKRAKPAAVTEKTVAAEKKASSEASAKTPAKAKPAAKKPAAKKAPAKARKSKAASSAK
jgi:excinuclease ABC subunit A